MNVNAISAKVWKLVVDIGTNCMNDAPDVIVGLPSTTPLSPKSTATVSLVGRQSGGTPAGRTNPGAITASLKHSKYLAPILTSHTLGSSLLVGRGGGAGTAYAEGPSWSVPAYGMFNQEPTAWCRSCGGGLPQTLNNSVTCCNTSQFNAKARWTVWAR